MVPAWPGPFPSFLHPCPCTHWNTAPLLSQETLTLALLTNGASSGALWNALTDPYCGRIW